MSTQMNKQLQKIQNYFENIYNKEKIALEIPNIDRKIMRVSLEVDERIIRKLEKFEKKESFLSPYVSLGNMSSDFKTNSTYLSMVIKNHKSTNFNSYINDLRIEYIIRKLESSPRYLTYKIAYLAKECGFSSHTVFIRVFTKKMGITPSKFINLLKNIK